MKKLNPIIYSVRDFIEGHYTIFNIAFLVIYTILQILLIKDIVGVSVFVALFMFSVSLHITILQYKFHTEKQKNESKL